MNENKFKFNVKCFIDIGKELNPGNYKSYIKVANPNAFYNDPKVSDIPKEFVQILGYIPTELCFNGIMISASV